MRNGVAHKPERDPANVADEVTLGLRSPVAEEKKEHEQDVHVALKRDSTELEPTASDEVTIIYVLGNSAAVESEVSGEQ